jgi:hypothetical protein
VRGCGAVMLMTVAMVMVAVMNMAMFGVRVSMDNEASERTNRSGRGLADPRRDCEHERNQPDQVSTALACSL